MGQKFIWESSNWDTRLFFLLAAFCWRALRRCHPRGFHRSHSEPHIKSCISWTRLWNEALQFGYSSVWIQQNFQTKVQDKFIELVLKVCSHDGHRRLTLVALVMVYHSLTLGWRCPECKYIWQSKSYMINSIKYFKCTLCIEKYTSHPYISHRIMRALHSCSRVHQSSPPRRMWKWLGFFLDEKIWINKY